MATLYLHGFLSTPESKKACLLRAAHRQRGIDFIAPDLSLSPSQAAQKILQEASTLKSEELCVVGSSLGGFYAAWLMHQLPLKRAVLLNPAVRPWLVTEDQLGWHEVGNTGRKIYVDISYAGELKAMADSGLSRSKSTLTVLGTADEVLDWTVARDFFAPTHQWILQGADHALSNFAPMIDPLMAYLIDGTIPG